MSGWVRLKDLKEADLPDDEKIRLVATAVHEYALCYALCIIHGPERGVQRYIDMGGHVRLDDGEVVIYSELVPS